MSLISGTLTISTMVSFSVKLKNMTAVQVEKFLFPSLPYLRYGYHDVLDFYPLYATFLGIRLEQICRVSIQLREEL